LEEIICISKKSRIWGVKRGGKVFQSEGKARTEQKCKAVRAVHNMEYFTINAARM
jgi:hypothetical protein